MFQNSNSIKDSFLKIGFRVPSNPRTQPLQPRERKAKLLLQLAANFDITHVVLVLGVHRIQQYGVKKTSTLIVEGLGGQAVCPRGQHVKL